MDIIRKYTRWYVTVIISVLFSICALIYFDAIEGLEKPAGLVEAFKFMFSAPEDYMVCLMCGGVAKFCFAAMFVVALGSIFSLIKVIYQYKVEYEEIDWKEVVEYIISFAAVIVLGFIQTNIICDFWILLVAAGLVLLAVKVWIDNG